VGENRKAHTLLLKALSLRPDAEALKGPLATIYLDSARGHRRAGDTERALKAAMSARDVISDSPDIWLLLAEIYEAAGRHQEAEGAYRRTLELDATSKAARLGLARFYQVWGMGTLATLSKKLAETPEGERAEVERDLRDLVVARYRLALEYGEGAPDVDIARNYLARQREAGIDVSAPLRERGRAELVAGDLDTGIDLLRQARATDGMDRDACWLLAEALRRRSSSQAVSADERQRDRDEAILCVERALGIDPEHLPSLYLACDLYYVKGRWADLETVGRRFLALSQDIEALNVERSSVEDRLRRAAER
jgi:tetratricopeptide (TPR) repeat protein